MQNDRLYEAVFHRRSVRRYDMHPLPQDVLDGVLAAAHAATPLDPSIRTEFVLRHAGHVLDPLAGRAPHYLCLFSEGRDGYLLNAGFLLQQVDLHLSASGLGACWLGLAQPGRAHAEEEQRSGLRFVVMLSFGRPAGPSRREGPSEFDRKPLSAFADAASFAAAGVPEPEALLEPVRLAPSATNSQPVRVSAVREAGVTVLVLGRGRLNPVKEAFLGRMNRIDAGIGLCCLALSLGHRGIPHAIGILPERDEAEAAPPAAPAMHPMARIALGKETPC